MNESTARDVFFAISDPTRREILQILLKEKQPLNALSRNFTITRTAVSKHLHVLCEAKLVRFQKVGRETIYELSAEPLAEVENWLSYYSSFWDGRLMKLKNFVENSIE